MPKNSAKNKVLFNYIGYTLFKEEMFMYIVVSNNNQLPLDLDSSTIEHWKLAEFMAKGHSDEGIDIEDGIYINTDCLTEDVYSELLDSGYAEASTAYGFKFVYYRFDTSPEVGFPMMEEVKVYQTPKEEPKEEPKVEQVEEKPSVPLTEEPQVQQPQVQEPFIPQGTTVLTSMDNPANMSQIPQQMPQQPNIPVETPQSQSVPPFVQTPTPSQPYTEQPYNGYNSNINNGSGQLYGQNPPQGHSGQLYGTQEPIYRPQPNIPTQEPIQEQPNQNIQIADGVKVASGSLTRDMSSEIFANNMNILIQSDPDEQNTREKNRKAAKVVLFGSSKGGTGKTFTCLATAYWYAKTHPLQSVALADFDIIDGQIGITVNKITPTMQNYYNLYSQGATDIDRLKICKVKSEYFSGNLDFYLAPAQDIPTITNDTEFWTTVFKLLITNYDVVFFDSGIDYLGKAPISQLYKIADKIIVTCNPSINSVKSVIKQFKTLSGMRQNNVFRASDDIMSRVNIVLTRVGDSPEINEIVVSNLVKHAPVIAAFGNIDNIISRVQWYQEWKLIDTNPEITEYLEEIAKI